MFSAINVERLIAEKKIELEKEKIGLGISSQKSSSPVQNGEQDDNCNSTKKLLNFAPLDENDCEPEAAKKDPERTEDLDGNIPPDLERYIRRYLGLPVMLRAGEYSPNNPLVRAERNSGDVLLALGEYERRRNTLRRMRQQQYKEYLDQQAKKKQEVKEQAQRERREREEREREREERERQREEIEQERREREHREQERRLAEQNRLTNERRRASDNYIGIYTNVKKVDSAVQVDSVTSPLSVAVQTDDADLYRLSSPMFQLTQAERELSPHTVLDPVQRVRHTIPGCSTTGPTWELRPHTERRRSYGDYDERPITVRKSNRDKLASDLRHSFMPSIYDADAIELRNLQAEKDAATRRQFYQQELRNQILEQQRIKEERKTRERMLEQAEMRRLEEQLKMLRVAQDKEITNQKETNFSMKRDAEEYDMQRSELQKEIDAEHQTLLRGPRINQRPPTRIETSRSDDTKLPRIRDRNDTAQERKAYSSKISDDAVLSSNYDVDSYLRKNLNFRDRFDRFDIDKIGNTTDSNTGRCQNNKQNISNMDSVDRYVTQEKLKPTVNDSKIIDRRKLMSQNSLDSLSIPVLRHAPLKETDSTEKTEQNTELSDGMRKVEEKWSVPAVQKNILKSIPNNDGNNISILTQLGSIRRQLQLEQMKLDRMSKTE